MTEAEARAALRVFIAVGDVAPWIAKQPWKAESGGWSVGTAARLGFVPF